MKKKKMRSETTTSSSSQPKKKKRKRRRRLSPFIILKDTANPLNNKKVQNKPCKTTTQEIEHWRNQWMIEGKDLNQKILMATVIVPERPSAKTSQASAAHEKIKFLQPELHKSDH